MKQRRNYYPHKHSWDTTARIGKIVPSFVKQVTMLDTWGGIQKSIARFSPMNKPVFGEFHYDTFFFYVKTSDIWNKSAWPAAGEEFRDVITNVDTSYNWPTINSLHQKGTQEDSLLHNGFGIGMAHSTTPTGVDLSKLPSMAYNHIFNKFFRDKSYAGSEIDINNVLLIKDANFKGKNYFYMMQQDIEQGSTVTVDTSGATLDISDVKDAMRAEDYAKLKARYGEEYEDILRLHGVNAFNQEGPMLIAKGTARAGISEVLSTSDSGTKEVGDYVGSGMIYSETHVPKRLFLEHGFIIGVNVLRPRLTVKQRIDKMYRVTTPEQLYHKYYVGNKMDTVKDSEIFTGLSSAGDFDNTYGYCEKYDYLRTTEDVVAGDYVNEDTYDDQIMAIQMGTFGDANPDHHNYLRLVIASKYNDLFQDSTQPHIFVHHRNNIGVSSIVPKRGV